MAKKSRIQGITIEIGGDTSQLQKELKKIDTSLKTTSEALKDINKLLKLDPKNTELLKQKQDALNKAINDTDNRLKTLKEAYAALDGKDTEEAKEQQKALAREIVETENNLKSLKKEAKDFGSVMSQQLKATGQELKEVGSKITGIGKDLSTKVTAPIIAAFTYSSKVASDYEENLNKLSVAFGDYASEVRQFTDNAYADYGLSKVDASEVASSFGAMAKGIGIADKEAGSMAATLTGLSADLASYFNTDIETAGTALEAIFTGNAQALKKFGVVLTDANLKEFALSLGMTAKQYKNLGSVEKTMLRYQYVLQQTSDAQGDFARTNDGMANATKTMEAVFKDLATVVGEQLLPIIVPVIQKITEFVGKLANANPELIEMAVKIGLAAAAFGPLLVVVGNIISIIGSLVSAIGLLATPTGLIIVAIAGIVTAIAGLIKIFKKLYDGSDKFRKKVDTFVTNIKNLFTLVFNHIKLTLQQIQTIFQTIFDTIKGIVDNRINAIKIVIETVLNVIKGLFATFGSLITGDFQGAFENLKNVAQSLMEGLKNIISNKLDGIKNAFSTVFSGVVSIVSNQVEKLKNMFNFRWQLPSIQVPHFRSINTGPLGLPKIEVDWYSKAMKHGMILKNPTIFGAMNGALLGGGEAGAEVVVGANSLMEMISRATASQPQINMTVNGHNLSANELAGVVIDKLKNEIQRNNNRW